MRDVAAIIVRHVNFNIVAKRADILRSGTSGQNGVLMLSIATHAVHTIVTSTSLIDSSP
jgi:hypothetical protein